MKATKATWSLALWCECPLCGDRVDLLQDTDFWDGRNLVPYENGTVNSTGVDVSCPHCEVKFTVDCEY